ncbi:MAG: sugar transferase [Candidatus Wallbacteria bacterium]|nr:sugar transferase [Candidatus Wallbacteria bacterium]
MLVLDLVLVNVSIIVSFYLRFGFFPEENFISYLKTWPIVTIVYLLIFLAYGLYDREESPSSIEVTYRMTGVCLTGFIFLNSIAFFARTFSFPRTVIMVSALVGTVLLTAHHLLWKKLFPPNPEKVVIYGDRKVMGDVEKNLLRQKNTFQILELCCFSSEATAQDREQQWKRLMAAVETSADAHVLLNADDFSKENLIEKIDFLLEKGVMVKVVPGLYEVYVGGGKLKDFAGIPCRELSYTPSTWLMLVKRVIDCIVSGLGLSLVLPFMPVVAILIKLDSRGPVFFTQERIGFNGRKFWIKKFRTMREEAERETGPVWAAENDPRVTRLGRFLRTYRIDEIPQLWNVLKGEMSLVGPRPEREFFIEKFTEQYPFFRKRLKVKPGLTGLAQIQGRYETDPFSKLKYDLLYIQNFSLLMDMEIIIHTCRVVLKGKGS